jgi:hypothetical protein
VLANLDRAGLLPMVTLSSGDILITVKLRLPKLMRLSPSRGGESKRLHGFHRRA